MEIIDFFIDTHCTTAYEHIIDVIDYEGSDDTNEKFYMKVLRDHDEGEGEHYIHLRGTWHSYKLFLKTPGINDKRYHYSLTHYEE